MSFRVLGTGMYVPPRVVTNDDLSQFLETNGRMVNPEGRRKGTPYQHK